LRGLTLPIVRIGIDLGGTKIEAIAIDAAGRERFRRRVSTPRGEYRATIESVARLVFEADRIDGEGTVGVGIPGALSPVTGLVKNANSTWLNGRSLQTDLEARLDRPVRLANDANCFALSEAIDGAGADRRVVFGVIVGTGTGAGIIVDGRVIVGANAITGEWGHNPMPWPGATEWPGPPCYCGRTGCTEVFLSGPGLARDHEQTTGERLEPAAIVERSTVGNEPARATLDRYAHRMARALAAVINVVDPDIIVLGGGLSNVRMLYDRVPQLWQPFVFSDSVMTPLVPARHGDSGGVRGAAWLWP
jgi:fructokinase